MPDPKAPKSRHLHWSGGKHADVPVTIRPASEEDSEFLLRMVNDVADGMPVYLWKRFAKPGQDPWDWARSRMDDPRSALSRDRAFVAERDGVRAGCIFVRSVPLLPPEIDAHPGSLFLPLSELEAMAAGTGYVYVLGAEASFTGRGVEAQLLAFAEEKFRGPKGMSTIVSDRHYEARDICDKAGYREVSRRNMLKEGWSSPGREWILMIKPQPRRH